ncbi:MAG: ATP-binding protein [Deltaproteobacteria bacterium]|nr:ATP-binding protein [Deltaproteobacteria bacterium]
MIHRDGHVNAVLDLLTRHPVIALLGARQVGKTTLAGQVARAFPGPVTRFDLEDPADLGRLEAPGLALRPLEGLVVLDEAQRRPDLFPLLRVLADRPDHPARFLVLGSASPDLIGQMSETLAGRVAFHALAGFSPGEVGTSPETLQRLWLRGGLPRAFLADTDGDGAEWLRGFLRTFLERDLGRLGVSLPADTLRRFWTMLAHWHGQVWNGAEFGRAFGVSGHTIRRYLDALVGTYVVRLMPPWHENLAKRQVRSPKVYLSDPGVLHALLGITQRDELLGHPKIGASWEGFAMDLVLRRLGAREGEAFFWATHAGAELDLLVVRGQTRIGFEIKRSEAPRVTPSIRAARDDLRLDRLTVVHAGPHDYPMDDGVDALGLARVWTALPPLP